MKKSKSKSNSSANTNATTVQKTYIQQHKFDLENVSGINYGTRGQIYHPTPLDFNEKCIVTDINWPLPYNECLPDCTKKQIIHQNSSKPSIK